MKKYRLIELFFVSLAIAELFIIVYGVSINSNKQLVQLELPKILCFFILFLCMGLMFLLRFLRAYVLLLDEKLDRELIFKVCIKTSFVNLFVPWKLGEIYRIVAFGNLLGSLVKGVIVIVMDRFFDIVPLVVSLLISYMLIETSWGGVSINILLCVSVFCFILGLVTYIVFPSTYGYLRESFLLREESSINNKVLRILKELNELYLVVNRMVKSRASLLILISVLAWGAEMISIWIVNTVLFDKFSAAPQDFLYQYLTDQILGNIGVTAVSFVIYKLSCVPVLLLLFYIFRCFVFEKGKKND